MLEKNGYEVFQARDGPEGIKAAVLHKPDMILLDIQLSSMDGHAVARALRTNPDMILIPIVAVTSYAMVGDRETAFSAGCSGFIEKPINPDTFMSQIEEYLLRGVTLTE